MCVGVVVVVGCLIAPMLGDPEISSSIFRLIQESQGYIEPGLLAAFTFGLLSRRTPAIAGVLALLLGPMLYGLMQYFVPGIAFLNRIAICYVALLIMMGLITWIAPRREPVAVHVQAGMNLESSTSAKIAGVIVVAVTILLYVIFW